MWYPYIGKLQSKVALYSFRVHLVFNPVKVVFCFSYDCLFDKVALPLFKTMFILTVL